MKAGDNFGWTEREGPFLVKDDDPTCSVYPLPADDARFGYVYPVIAYDHDPPAGFPRCRDTGDAVVGGFVYRGTGCRSCAVSTCSATSSTGACSTPSRSRCGGASGARPSSSRRCSTRPGPPVTMQELAGDPRVDLRLGQDDAGEIYVLSKANGKIWKVTGARWLDAATTTSGEAPACRRALIAGHAPGPPRLLETAALTALALIAFAANSILTRMALAPGHIDAAGFTAVRLATGALMLAALVRRAVGDLVAGCAAAPDRGRWRCSRMRRRSRSPTCASGRRWGRWCCSGRFS